MSNAFRSIATASQQAQEAEALAVLEAKKRLESLAASRQAATMQANLLNTDASQTTRIEVPLSVEEREIIRQLGEGVNGPHGLAVLKVIREYMPDLFGTLDTVN